VSTGLHDSNGLLSEKPFNVKAFVCERGWARTTDPLLKRPEQV
jgi:hypothetical protein